jgi:uncharacterized membrane protein
VISLEVPESYDELMHDLRGFLGFAICFAVLMWIWHAHYTFFRRYGMTDGPTLVLNTMLLFLVLYYVYPLKFLFAAVTGGARSIRTIGDVSNLFVIYGLGFAGIFALLFLLYRHAFKQREVLELNEYEIHDTRTSMVMYAAYVGIGLLSTGVALYAPPRMIGLAGWTYFLLGPVSAAIGAKRGYGRRALHKRQVEMAQTIANASETAAVPTVAANGP